MNCADRTVDDIPLPTPHYHFCGQWFTADRYRLLRWCKLRLTREQWDAMMRLPFGQMLDAAHRMLKDNDAG